PVRSVLRALVLLLLFVACAAGPGCTCSHAQVASSATVPCLTQRPAASISPGPAPAVTTVAAGTIAGSFSVSSAGDAVYTIPLVSVPGRAGIEPRLAIASAGSGDGILGQGFSLTGISTIHRCPPSLAQGDGEIRGVRYDASD